MTDKRKTTLPEDSAARKELPLYSGLVRFFPAALAGVARVSLIGGKKHRPGLPLGHSRGLSGDHADTIVRHLVDMAERGGVDEHGVPQVYYVAWRALALAQEWAEEHEGAPLAPAAVLPETQQKAEGWDCPYGIERCGEPRPGRKPLMCGYCAQRCKPGSPAWQPHAYITETAAYGMTGDDAPPASEDFKARVRKLAEQDAGVLKALEPGDGTWVGDHCGCMSKDNYCPRCVPSL